MSYNYYDSYDNDEFDSNNGPLGLKSKKKAIMLSVLVGFGVVLTLIGLILIITTNKSCKEHFDSNADYRCDYCNELLIHNSDDINAAINAKYGGAVLCNKPLCGNKNVAIYDEELDVYIQLSTDLSFDDAILISGYSKTLDSEKYCLLTINTDGSIVSVQHCTPELSGPTLMIVDKYMGLFACTDTCGSGSIAVYDEEFGLYVIFDEDSSNKGCYDIDDFFGPTAEEYGVGDCLGVVDFENRTITITKHSELHEYMNSIDDIYFTAIGLTNNCDVAIHYKEKYYIKCYEAPNGKYRAFSAFWSPLNVACCIGVIDIENQTITITQHGH